jgi:hypothetical protein
MCSKVDLTWNALEGLKEIKFKDKEQEEKFMRGKHFSGKVVYTGEENKVNTMPVNGGMEM